MRLEALPPAEKRKAKNGFCIEKFCRKRRPKKGKRFVGLRCSCCARRKWAEENPVKYVLANLRGNARRRGKEFSLTLEEFKKFTEKEKYFEKPRGREKLSISVDREKNEFGYHAWNIKAITIQANSVKRAYVDYGNGYPEDQGEDLPF